MTDSITSKRIVLRVAKGNASAYLETDPICRTHDVDAPRAIGMLVMRYAAQLELEIYEPAAHDDASEHIAAVDALIREIAPEHGGAPRAYKPRECGDSRRFYVHRVDWTRGGGFVVYGCESAPEGVANGSFALESFLRDWEPVRGTVRS